jgi:hypothetical protein
MTKSIVGLVDRGLAIRAQLKELNAELKEITESLESFGIDQPHEDLKDQDREGKRWMAWGSKLIVPIVFTADKILGEFRAGTVLNQKIDRAADGHLREFFKPINKWENLFDDGKKFRARAAELLEAKAPAFITACLARDKHGIPKSDVKILWDDAEPII